MLTTLKINMQTDMICVPRMHFTQTTPLPTAKRKLEQGLEK
jgi:hypothetical protein